MTPDELGRALADCISEATVDDFERNSDDREDHKWESMKDFGNVCWVYRELILSALATQKAVEDFKLKHEGNPAWPACDAGFILRNAAELLATWTNGTR